MNYPFLLNLIQYAALAALAMSAISVLRLMTLQFTLHDWNHQARQSFSTAAAVQALALLAFAFASGGVLALHFFQTSDLPPLSVLLFRLVLLCVLSASVVFMVSIAKPWLLELPDGPMPLHLSLNRLTALTFSFAGFTAALIIQLLTAWVLPTELHAGHLALMTLLFWSIIAVPSLALGSYARFAEREINILTVEVEALDDRAYIPRRHVPQLVELPLQRPNHVPARRAPRPSLATPQEIGQEIGIGYAIA